MRAKVAKTSPVTALTRLLAALGEELLAASDEEILAAARELGMDPAMPGSAAFAGLKYPAKAQLSDFFDLDACRLLAANPDACGLQSPRKPRTAKQRSLAPPRKRPTGH